MSSFEVVCKGCLLRHLCPALSILGLLLRAAQDDSRSLFVLPTLVPGPSLQATLKMASSGLWSFPLVQPLMLHIHMPLAVTAPVCEDTLSISQASLCSEPQKLICQKRDL